jgi:hypothetical protein
MKSDRLLDLDSSVDSVEEMERALLAWSGSGALVLRYTASLSILSLWLSKHCFDEGLLVSCLETYSIRAPTLWRPAGLSMVRSSFGRELCWCLRDDAAGVEIQCSEFLLKEGRLNTFVEGGAIPSLPRPSAGG